MLSLISSKIRLPCNGNMLKVVAMAESKPRACAADNNYKQFLLDFGSRFSFKDQEFRATTSACSYSHIRDNMRREYPSHVRGKSIRHRERKSLLELLRGNNLDKRSSIYPPKSLFWNFVSSALTMCLRNIDCPKKNL